MESLLSLLGRRKHHVALVYALTLADNLVSVAIPAAIGAAIDGVLHERHVELFAFVALWLVGSGLSAFRQSYDTRVFTGLSAEFASAVATHQNKAGHGMSVVAARSNLSREAISFFAQDLPMILRGAISSIGALALLFFYDLRVALFCAAMLVPIGYANILFFGRSKQINKRYNNRLERELNTLRSGHRGKIQKHYWTLSRRRIALSDGEALTSLTGRAFALVALVGSLLVLPGASESPGSLFSIVSYVLLFFTGLADLPLFVGGMGRLHDITSRLKQAQA